MSGGPNLRPLVLSEAPDQYSSLWLSMAIDQITRAIHFTLRRDRASDRVLLLSPAGKVFKVTVSDAGVLSATEVPQGDSNQ